MAAARELRTSRDPAEVSIQEITDAADVGFGSLCNHFQSKQELFDAAVAEVLEEHGAMLEKITAGIDDPAEVFAASVNERTGKAPASLSVSSLRRDFVIES